MVKPTPEEIAKVEAWQEERRRKQVFHMLLVDHQGKGNLTFKGIIVDKTWPPRVLIALVREAMTNPAYQKMR